MSLTFRTLIVPDAHVALARQLAATLAGTAGDGMWTAPLSATGSAPATHWISTGWIEESFAELMPLSDWRQDEQGAWYEYDGSNGAPWAVVALAAEAGVVVALAEVEALFAASDITEQEWALACGRMGLAMVMVMVQEATDG